MDVDFDAIPSQIGSAILDIRDGSILKVLFIDKFILIILKILR